MGFGREAAIGGIGGHEGLLSFDHLVEDVHGPLELPRPCFESVADVAQCACPGGRVVEREDAFDLVEREVDRAQSADGPARSSWAWP